MVLAFTPQEQAFRDEIRGWVKEHLPADIAHKVHNALRLSRDDMQRWAHLLCGPVDPGSAISAATVVDDPALAERVAVLERTVEQLRAELEDLRQRLGMSQP